MRLRHLMSDAHWSAITTALGLSRRERQIVELALADAAEDVMAASIGISTHTVHTYIERLYRKLGVRSRSQLVTRIFEVYLSATEDVEEPLSNKTGARQLGG